jgi:hypothetical protein
MAGDSATEENVSLLSPESVSDFIHGLKIISSAFRDFAGDAGWTVFCIVGLYQTFRPKKPCCKCHESLTAPTK